MKKIKFFLDPINNLEAWLNEMAKKGYRLKAINNFVYDFEKTDKDYTYSTQFIGANSSNEWSGLSMIVSSSIARTE